MSDLLSTGNTCHIAEIKDNTSTTPAKSDMQQHVSNVALPDEDISSIEYSMVIEPEYMVVFEEKEYQQVQVSCTDFIDTMETEIKVACTTGVLCSSNAYSKEPLCSLEIVSHQARTSGLLFFYALPCYVGIHVSD